MQIEMMDIGQIKNHPDNPRVIKDEKFEKLVKSIQDFPEMLHIRPIVINNDFYVLGGNMRLKACKEAGLKLIPVIKASDLTEEQQRKFMIKDNTNAGEWDFEGLDNWEPDFLEELELDMVTEIAPDVLEKPEIEDDEFEKEVETYTDENCQLPITPNFHEKYSYFIILCDNEIDEQFIRNTFGLNVKHTSHKSTDDRLSNVISFEKLQEVCLK